jgi:hypothetical protein
MDTRHFQEYAAFKMPSGGCLPLLPPLGTLVGVPTNSRGRYSREYLLQTRLLGNDFATICRSLKPTSRNILVDMGASLNFHGNKTPAII